MRPFIIFIPIAILLFGCTSEAPLGSTSSPANTALSSSIPIAKRLENRSHTVDGTVLSARIQIGVKSSIIRPPSANMPIDNTSLNNSRTLAQSFALSLSDNLVSEVGDCRSSGNRTELTICDYRLDNNPITFFTAALCGADQVRVIGFRGTPRTKTVTTFSDDGTINTGGGRDLDDALTPVQAGQAIRFIHSRTCPEGSQNIEAEFRASLDIKLNPNGNLVYQRCANSEQNGMILPQFADANYIASRSKPPSEGKNRLRELMSTDEVEKTRMQICREN